MSSNYSINPVIGSDGRRGVLSFVGVIVFFTVWTTVSYLGWVNSLLLPSPIRVFESIHDVGFALIIHSLATLTRVVVGFSVGVFIGMSVGTLMQYNRNIYQILDGVVETFRPVPPVALVPFFILVFGFSEFGKLLIIFMGVGLLITITTIEAIKRVPAPIIRWGLTVGLNRQDLFRLVIFPAALPEMRGGFRIALALAITLVIVSEFMGATYGLGYLISVSKVTLTTPTLLLTIIILGWLGWGLDRIVQSIFNRTTAWDIRAKGTTK